MPCFRAQELLEEQGHETEWSKPSSVCWAVCWGQRTLEPSHFTFWPSSTLCRRNWESKKSQFAQGQKVEICEANILEADLFYSPGSPSPQWGQGNWFIWPLVLLIWLTIYISPGDLESTELIVCLVEDLSRNWLLLLFLSAFFLLDAMLLNWDCLV